MTSAGLRSGRPPVRLAFALLLAYLAVHVALRVALSGSVELDEAEQLLHAQRLRLGYGPQPPLYEWLQALGFSVLGESVLALSVVKHGLLFLTYLFTYLSARSITGDATPALFAMTSLLLFPQISFESHRALTHSVLATSLCVGVLFALVRLVQDPRPFRYALLGVVTGLALLAKYNCGVVLAGLFLAALSLPHPRRVLLDPRVGLTLLAAGIVLAPHVLWILDQPAATLLDRERLHLDQAPGHALALAWGALDVGGAVAWLTWPAALAYVALIACGRSGRSPRPDHTEPAALPLRAVLLSLALVLVALGAFRVPELKGRWLQPLLPLVPVYVAARFGHRIDRVRLHRMVWLGALVGVAVLAALSLRVLGPGLTHRPAPLRLPLERLAAELGRRGFTAGVVVARREISGGLRLHLTQSIGIAPRAPSPETPGDLPWLVVWRETEGAEWVPVELQTLVERLRPACWTARPIEHLVLPYRPPAEIPATFGLLLLAPSAESGRCPSDGGSGRSGGKEDRAEAVRPGRA